MDLFEIDDRGRIFLRQRVVEPGHDNGIVVVREGIGDGEIIAVGTVEQHVLGAFDLSG